MIAELVFLVAAESAVAQEIRYIHDQLGQLIGAVDQEGRTAIYEYDAVGNFLAIRRQDADGDQVIAQ